MTTLEYQGYQASIEPDLGAGILFGRVLNTHTVITFAADAGGRIAECGPHGARVLLESGTGSRPRHLRQCRSKPRVDQLRHATSYLGLRAQT